MVFQKITERFSTNNDKVDANPCYRWLGMKRSRKMAPFEEKFQNDATFQCLLSSQRQLLSRLNSEKHLIHEPQCSVHNQSTYTEFPNVTNHSIGHESFRSDNVVLSKRMSIGVGADDFILPDPNFDTDHFTESSYDEVCRKQIKDGHDPSAPNKRRRPTLAFLDYIFEKNPEPMTNSETEPAPKRSRNRVEYNDSDDEDYGVIMEDVYTSDEELAGDDECNEECYFPRMHPEEAKRHLVVFENAMGRSQDSQQQIHDWDKKMGLKRSHSKTMRLSSRSRKQLRQFTQKDIEHISTVS
jgi:hypothetical protein